MVTYQFIAYRLSVTLADGDPDEYRPIADFDARGSSLLESLGSILVSMGGRRLERTNSTLHIITSSPTRMEGNEDAAGWLGVTIDAGRNGVRSRIKKPDNKIAFNRTPDLSENFDLSHFLHFPKNGKHAVLFASKVGVTSALGILNPMLTEAFQGLYRGFSLNIELIEDNMIGYAVSENAEIRAWHLRRPAKGDPGSVHDGVKHKTATVSIDVKGLPRQGLKTIRGRDNATPRDNVFGVIKREASLPESWLEGSEAHVTVTLPGGRERTILVGSDTDLGFSAVITSQTPTPGPSDIRETLVGMVTDLQGHLGVANDEATILSASPLDWPLAKIPAAEVFWSGRHPQFADVPGSVSSPSPERAGSKEEPINTVRGALTMPGSSGS